MTLKLKPLLDNEMSKQGFTHRLDFSWKDIDASVANNTAVTATVAGLPAGSIIFDADLILVTPFEDLSDAAYNTTTCSLGDDGSATRVFSAVELNRNGTEVNDSYASAVNHRYTAADHLILTLNSMSGKSVSNLDAGQAMIRIRIGSENRAAIIDNATP